MMNRRKNKSRPLSVMSHCNTSPILCRPIRPSSACSSAVPHSLSLSFTWQDTNNNSNYDSRSEPWNNFQVCVCVKMCWCECLQSPPTILVVKYTNLWVIWQSVRQQDATIGDTLQPSTNNWWAEKKIRGCL